MTHEAEMLMVIADYDIVIGVMNVSIMQRSILR